MFFFSVFKIIFWSHFAFILIGTAEQRQDRQERERERERERKRERERLKLNSGCCDKNSAVMVHALPGELLGHPGITKF